ncbi:Glycine/D-amino acid oxidase [Natronincola peptidivorans]|uniref:Glycine/D-amino acid oxidase n=1 Tax=Natronincola peptidivorans TaxID=426128 RepID=A0A1I0AR20_9FIRM|nr:FAD-dependent oxidoreductase [Natronincola peptidivorans]SES96626.1 Glycine/D-amino acid oxidase [Natronincola peptidivorans]
MKDNNYEEVLGVMPQSFWLASTENYNFPALREDIHVDVALVGGGMVGITTALLLKKEGLKVAVLESDAILQGTTGHTTAKITSQHGLIYDKIKGQMGEEKAKQYAEANESAIQMISELIEENDIDCDFSWQPAYVYTQSDAYVQKIIDETKTASALGIMASYLEDIPLPFSVKAAMRFDGQAQFHPRKYLLSLAKKIHGDGCAIFEKTKAVDIQEGAAPTVITAGGNKVTSSYVIIASHYPFYDKPGLYFSRIYPKRSYVLGIIIKEKFPLGMYINAEEPARSLRCQSFENRELILVGGEHHKTAHGKSTTTHYKNLMDFAHETFQVERIFYRWSTQDGHTPDGVPYIGQLAPATPNIFVATAFHKWGMTNSTASAMILKDLIVKGENPWAPVYQPSRITPSITAAASFVKENVDVAINFVSGKLMSSTPEIEKKIQPNEGKVMEVDGKRIGAYRDKNGKLHLVDTTCTHMYCELQWNDAETTWDCPCHGSRFSPEGDVIEGPALEPLTKLN